MLVRSRPMLDHYRFQSDANRFLHELQLSKHMAQVAHCDIVFELTQDKESWVCTRKTDEPLKVAHVLKKKIPFRFLSSIKLNDEQVDKLVLNFTGTGWINKQGDLLLESKRGETYGISLPQVTKK